MIEWAVTEPARTKHLRLAVVDAKTGLVIQQADPEHLRSAGYIPVTELDAAVEAERDRCEDAARTTNARLESELAETENSFAAIDAALKELVRHHATEPDRGSLADHRTDAEVVAAIVSRLQRENTELRQLLVHRVEASRLDEAESRATAAEARATTAERERDALIGMLRDRDLCTGCGAASCLRVTQLKCCPDCSHAGPNPPAVKEPAKSNCLICGELSPEDGSHRCPQYRAPKPAQEADRLIVSAARSWRECDTSQSADRGMECGCLDKLADAVDAMTGHTQERRGSHHLDTMVTEEDLSYRAVPGKVVARYRKVPDSAPDGGAETTMVVTRAAYDDLATEHRAAIQRAEELQRANDGLLRKAAETQLRLSELEAREAPERAWERGQESMQAKIANRIGISMGPIGSLVISQVAIVPYIAPEKAGGAG